MVNKDMKSLLDAIDTAYYATETTAEHLQSAHNLSSDHILNIVLSDLLRGAAMLRAKIGFLDNALKNNLNLSAEKKSH